MILQNIEIPAAGSNNRSRKFRSNQEIEDWLIAKISIYLELTANDMVKPRNIDICKTLSAYDLDDAEIAQIADDLENWIGFNIAPDVMDNRSTIASITKYLVFLQVIIMNNNGTLDKLS